MKEKTIVEKWFPETFDELILPERIKNRIQTVMKNDAFRLLLFSSPGTGKSTTARLMAKSFSTIYLSGSNDFTVETLRGKIYPFASGMAVDGKQKMVIIDEAERIRADLQDAFKIAMDQMRSVSFIFITNHVEKMGEAIQSRCEKIEYNFTGPELVEQQRNYLKYIAKVCDAEGIQYRIPVAGQEKPNLDGINKLFQIKFPDFRNTLITLDVIKSRGGVLDLETVEALFASGKQNVDVYEIIETQTINGKELYERMSVYRGKEREVFESLGTPFFKHLNDSGRFEHTIKSSIVIAKYSNMYVTTIDKFTTLFACIVELKQTIFK